MVERKKSMRSNVGAAENMLSELDNMLTEMSGSDFPSSVRQQRKKHKETKSKGKRDERKRMKTDPWANFEIPKIPVPVSDELKKALEVKKEVDKLTQPDCSQGATLDLI